MLRASLSQNSRRVQHTKCWSTTSTIGRPNNAAAAQVTTAPTLWIRLKSSAAVPQPPPRQQQLPHAQPGRFVLGGVASNPNTRANAPPRLANNLQPAAAAVVRSPQQQQQQQTTLQQQQESRDAVNRKMMEFFKRPPTPLAAASPHLQPTGANNDNNNKHTNGVKRPNHPNRMLQQQQHAQQPSFPQQYANRRQDSEQQQQQDPTSASWRGINQPQQQQQGNAPTSSVATAAATPTPPRATLSSLNGQSSQQPQTTVPAPSAPPPRWEQRLSSSSLPLSSHQQHHHHQQPDLVDILRQSFSLPPPSSLSSSSSSGNNSAAPSASPSSLSPSPLGWRHGNGTSSALHQRTTDPSDISKLRTSLFQKPLRDDAKQETDPTRNSISSGINTKNTPWTLNSMRSVQQSQQTDSWRPQGQQQPDGRLLDSNNNNADGIGPPPGSMAALRQTLSLLMRGLEKSSSPSNNASTATTTTDSPLFSSTSENFQSPLSEKILAMQLKNAQQKLERSSQTWRDSSNNNNNTSPLRDLRRQAASRQKQQYQEYRQAQHASRMDVNALEQRILGSANSATDRTFSRRRRPRIGSGRGALISPLAQSGKSVRVLQHDYTLTEVSLLVRVSTRQLRRLLRMIGEGARLQPLPQTITKIKKNNAKQDDKNDNNNSKNAEKSRHVADEDIILEPDIVELMAMELKLPVERVAETRQNDDQILLQRRALAEAASEASSTTGGYAYDEYPPRPPVVCIMGHVDHGKTTLMDALRRRAQNALGAAGKGAEKKKKKNKDEKGKKSKDAANGNIAGTEAGGITQVISAFQVPLLAETDDVDAVTFLDTPGHAAFKAMRQSGSDAADIIVLVVAADDGVSPQTVEIINFYKSIVKSSGDGGISMVVAMNKIDKPGINVEQAQMKIEGQLLEHGIMTEGMRVTGSAANDYGQPVQLIPVSGLTGEGLDDLIDGLVVQSEIMDLRADEKDKAEGVVMDARVEKGLGIVVDCIIRWGSIRKGSVVVCGTCCGKVRILKDVNNKMIEEGLPSQPVRIVGFEDLPKAGDPIVCVDTEEEAEELVEKRKAAMAAADGSTVAGASQGGQAELQSSGKHLMNYLWRERLEDKHNIEDEDVNAPIRIPVIIRADADGTLAAIREAVIEIGKTSKHNVVIDPIHEGVGPTLATDIGMAKLSDASIICFNVKNEAVINTLAEEEGVPLLRNNVIYALLDEAREILGRHLPTIPTEVVHGRGTVRAVYEIGGIDCKVAGLEVEQGKFYKDKAPPTETSGGKLKCFYRVLRKGKVISVGDEIKATSLKHFKEDVMEVSRGKECGLSLHEHSDYVEDDVIECFSIEQMKQTV